MCIYCIWIASNAWAGVAHIYIYMYVDEYIYIDRWILYNYIFIWIINMAISWRYVLWVLPMHVVIYLILYIRVSNRVFGGSKNWGYPKSPWLFQY